MTDNLPTDEAGWHRWFAAGFFNQAWTHLDSKEPLTQEQKDEMLAAALASRLHWSGIGTPMNFAIGDWQVARVYAVLGNAHEAIRYGKKSLANTEKTTSARSASATPTKRSHEAKSWRATLLVVPSTSSSPAHA